MTVGAKIATVNSKEVQLDAPAVIVNGRTLAPARFVAETFGYTVQWDAENKIVKINGKESVAHSIWDAYNKGVSVRNSFVSARDDIYRGKYTDT